MAYTTFYCNENMLLDHWQDYHESNLMLRNLLKRTSISPIECATIYYERMKNPESVSYDRSHLIQMFSRGRKNNAPILDVHQVVLYQKDLDYITEARRKYHINYAQLRATICRCSCVCWVFRWSSFCCFGQFKHLFGFRTASPS